MRAPPKPGRVDSLPRIGAALFFSRLSGVASPGGRKSLKWRKLRREPGPERQPALGATPRSALGGAASPATPRQENLHPLGKLVTLSARLRRTPFPRFPIVHRPTIRSSLALPRAFLDLEAAAGIDSVEPNPGEGDLASRRSMVKA